MEILLSVPLRQYTAGSQALKNRIQYELCRLLTDRLCSCLGLKPDQLAFVEVPSDSNEADCQLMLRPDISRIVPPRSLGTLKRKLEHIATTWLQRHAREFQD